MSLLAHQQQFIELALEVEALCFGDFTLKSGRKSPYFFNAGQFNTGDALWRLAGCYLGALKHAEVEFDQIFGPAYKGIPLACALAMQFFNQQNRSVPYSFNRKEEKDHGDGGMIVGAPLAGRVVLVDDVITAGTAIGECLPLIEQSGASLAGIVIAFDRQEKGKSDRAATAEVSERYNVPVIPIITLADLVTYLETDKAFQSVLPQINTYRETYGV